MKPLYWLLLFMIALSPLLLKAQDANKPKHVNLPLEKVYLFLDRSYYVSGDDIWFKAYLVSAYTNKLYDNSNCLYVELVSPESKIISRQCIKLEKGLGCGDFHIKDSIPSGKYQIRAYTNWMRNFDETFFFKKEIDIENLIGMANTNRETPQKNKDSLDIQFFPEGGSMIEDVYTVIGFKAINSSGMGVSVKGWIMSSLGDTIRSFESKHLGMGNFNFIPKQGQDYVAIVQAPNGKSYRKALPKALKIGYTLKASEINKNDIRVTVKTNQNTLSQYANQELLIFGSSRGALCVSARLKVKALVNNINIPKQEFPNGIARVTLFDTIGRPHGERLIYIEHQKQLSLEISTDKKTYAPRQKVTVQISLKDTANKPVSANLSLAAVDASYIKTSGMGQSDIASYFLLESEIRGNIEQPSYYFDTTNTDRYKALDQLLLTQGWRDFIWKQLSDSAFKFQFPIEKGISITGKLRKLLVNKPIPNANISLGLFGGSTPFMYATQTDSLGKYYFDGLNFSGARTLIVSATNKNYRNQGWISLDSLFGYPPPIDYTGGNRLSEDEKSDDGSREEANRRYNILKKYRLSDTIALSEVVIKGRRPEKPKDDGHFRMYGSPDYSIDVTDQMASYTDIFRLLQGRVAGLMIMGNYPNISFSMRGSSGAPLFLLDGVTVDIDLIASIPVTDIEKIEVLKNGASLALFGSQGGNGVISVFTKTGVISSTKPVFHSINQKINGLYEARTFYSPNYETKIPEHEKPDLRATIYWGPNIMTDVNGNATLSFFNSDAKTKIKINVEGISESGVPLVKKIDYQIK
jgi:TonB-dependent SusC/RagA subfamily outer membrane receptor